MGPKGNLLFLSCLLYLFVVSGGEEACKGEEKKRDSGFFSRLFYKTLRSGKEESEKENIIDDNMLRRSHLVPFREDSNRQDWVEPLSPWGRLSRFDDELFDLGRHLHSLDRDLGNFMRGVTSPGWMDRMDMLAPSIESCERGEEGTDSGKYIMNVPLGRNLGPEDVKISLKNHIMTIEAKKEHKSEDGRSRMYQEYMRKFTLPEKINEREVKSVLTPEGYLKVEAPLPHEALPEPPQPAPIPISYT